MAGKGFTRVNFVTMDSVEEDFRLTQASLKSELEALQKKLEQLLPRDPDHPELGFVGPAGEAYNTNKDLWQKSADDSYGWMTRITALLEEISSTYKITDRVTADIWHVG